MNDRFKFRAWHKPTKRMFEVYCFTDKHVFENTLDGVGTSPTNPANIEDCILEQCTGLKDKKDKLIYEGDIVKLYPIDLCIESYFCDEYSYKVVFWNCRFGLTDLDVNYPEQGDTFDFELAEYDYKVIGNIHENPELLENK